MRRRMEGRVLRHGRPVHVDAAPAEHLPYAEASFEAVVSTLVLCTVALCVNLC
jgi:hypothetical protein